MQVFLESQNWVGIPGRPPYVTPRGSAGWKKLAASVLFLLMMLYSMILYLLLPQMKRNFFELTTILDERSPFSLSLVLPFSPLLLAKKHRLFSGKEEGNCPVYVVVFISPWRKLFPSWQRFRNWKWMSLFSNLLKPTYSRVNLTNRVFRFYKYCNNTFLFDMLIFFLSTLFPHFLEWNEMKTKSRGYFLEWMYI